MPYNAMYNALTDMFRIHQQFTGQQWNAKLIDLRETKNKPDTFPTNRKSSSGYKIYIFL